MLRRSAAVVLVGAAIIAGAGIKYSSGAQDRTLALGTLLSFPFPDQLAVSPVGSMVA